MTQMLVNPIVAMIHDVENNRWHPILYVEAPLPGPDHDGKPVRHKSKMHHTTGFPTREAALANAKELAETVVKEGCWTTCKMAIADGEDIPWDGKDIPADTAFFADRGDGTMKRVM